MNNNFNLGERIRELRTQQSLSQEQLALRAEITTAYLGLIERNLKNPTVKVIEQLCNAFHITLADFFSTTTGSPESCDLLSAQIMAQLHNRTPKEKKLILQIIKNIIKFRDLSD